MLSTNQLGHLTSLFTQQAIQEPLQNTLEKFGNLFSLKLEHFRVGSALLTLIQYDHTISDFPEYRLLAILFVLELYKNEQIRDHPFLALFGRLLNRVNSIRSEQPDQSAQNAQMIANGGLNGLSHGAAAVAGANPTKNLNFGFDIFSNSALPILTDSERNILKSLMLEKLGIKTKINRSFLMTKSILFLLSRDNIENLKCNIELPVDIDVALMERREKLSNLVTSGVSSISVNERRKAGSMFDLILADEKWNNEQKLKINNNSSFDETKPKNKDNNNTACSSSVIDTNLLEKIHNNQTDNLIVPSAGRIFRPTMRYPPPPINFLIEDELAWCDLDEVSMDVHDFEYNFAQEDKWLDFLEIPSKVNLENNNDSGDTKNLETPKTENSKLSRKKLKEQLKIAVKEILPPDEADRVRETLNTLDEPKDPAKLGILPEHMCDLINQNSLIAVELVVYIANYNLEKNKNKKRDKSKDKTKDNDNNQYSVKEYLRVLLQDEGGSENVDLLKSLETINRLTCRVTLPDEFLHLYISNLIVTVENRRKEGKVHETKRTVRLVCIFIRSLISTNCLGVKGENTNIINEIQKFCVDFREESESVKLFRFIKSKMGIPTSSNSDQQQQQQQQPQSTHNLDTVISTVT